MEDKVFELLTEMYSKITEQFKEVNNRLTGVDTRLTAVDTRLTAVDARLTAVESKLDGKADKSDIARLENELNPKVQALFDGYKQHSDILERIEKEVTRQDEIIMRRIK